MGERLEWRPEESILPKESVRSIAYTPPFRIIGSLLILLLEPLHLPYPPADPSFGFSPLEMTDSELFSMIRAWLNALMAVSPS